MILATGTWQRPRPNRQNFELAPSIDGASLVRAVNTVEPRWRVIPDLVVEMNRGITSVALKTWSQARSGPSVPGNAPRSSTQQSVSDAVIVMRDPLLVAVAALVLQWEEARAAAR